MLHSMGTFPICQKYKNPEMDRLIEEAKSETDLLKRKQLYAKIQEIEYEDVPHLVIHNPLTYRTQRSWVKGWIPSPIFGNAPYDSYYYPIYKSAD